MAKPDKTDLLNASVARSMKAWAKATVDLDRQRERQGVRLVSTRALRRVIAHAG